MKRTDPIRMSDYHHRRVVAFAPVDAARQFRLSAILAGAIILATVAVAAGTFSPQPHQAQAPSTMVDHPRPS